MEDGGTPGKSEKDDQCFQSLSAAGSLETEIESLCVNCTEQGTTKLMLTKIPFFRDVIVSSFDCPHCHYSNCELSSAIKHRPVGVEFVVNVNDALDLDRILAKSDQASVTVQGLEIAARTPKGEVTTIKKILNRVVSELRQDQPRMKDEHPEAFEQIEVYLNKIEDCLTLKTNFTLTLRDITGKSFIGPRHGVMSISEDPNLHSKQFTRTKEEDQLLGIQECPVVAEGGKEEDDKAVISHFKQAVLSMANYCSSCNEPCFTEILDTGFPLFKDFVVMSTDCDKCGCRRNELRKCDGVEPKGKKVTLNVKSMEDFRRDVLKSDTCFIEIPELDLHAGSGTFVGNFTTIKGLLLDIKKQLSDQIPLIGGNSVDPTLKGKMEKLDGLLTGKTEFTIILDDPAGICHIQNLYAPEDDPEMTIEEYERSFEQNEELGLNDMNVGDQEQPSASS